MLDLLYDTGLVTRAQIDDARRRLNGGSVVEVLVNDGVVSEDEVSRSLAGQAQMRWVNLSEVVVP
ncbi:MAG TPA: hypothetical protein VGI85_10865, partial [Chthoniobacterales bacterium]